MTTFTDTKVISLNSESASLKNGTYLSSVSFNLQGLLRNEQNIIHTQLALQNAQVPVSFYIINYTNKTFVIRFSGTDYVVDIPVGNYNANSLATALKSGILSATIGLGGGVSVTIAISSTTGIFTFTCGIAFTIRASLPSFTMQIPLGTGMTDLVATTSGLEYGKTLPYPCNLLGTKLLQINSPTISGNNYASNLNGQTTLLATIPVIASSFGLILYADTADTRVSFNNNTLDGIDIDIVDAETGKYINFNNCHWTMTLLLHITRIYGEWKNQTAPMENLAERPVPLAISQPLTEKKPLSKNEKDLQLLQS
jgi:hypothetical protein